MKTQTEWIEISAGDLADVTGGDGGPLPSPTGFLDGAYKNGVFHFASKVGGEKLAEKMYGGHVTAADKARAQSALKQFLVDGDKLPKGVPELFQ